MQCARQLAARTRSGVSSQGLMTLARRRCSSAPPRAANSRRAHGSTMLQTRRLQAARLATKRRNCSGCRIKRGMICASLPHNCWCHDLQPRPGGRGSCGHRRGLRMAFTRPTKSRCCPPSPTPPRRSGYTRLYCSSLYAHVVLVVSHRRLCCGSAPLSLPPCLCKCCTTSWLCMHCLSCPRVCILCVWLVCHGRSGSPGQRQPNPAYLL